MGRGLGIPLDAEDEGLSYRKLEGGSLGQQGKDFTENSVPSILAQLL